MNKNILLAGLLSIIAIFGTVYIYNHFFLDETAEETAEPVPVEPEPEQAVEVTPQDTEPLVLLPLGEGGTVKNVTLDNDLFRLTFTTRGGRMTSAVLKEFGTELVLESAGDILPFGIRAGGYNGKVLDVPFHYSLSSAGDEIEFYQDFITGDGRAVTCRKTFTVLPDEYMLRVEVSFESENGDRLPTDGEGFLYSLEYGPQVGPEFEQLEGTGDYRYYHISRSGEKRNMRAPAEGFHVMDEAVDWLGIEGKYFAVISIPPERDYRLAWDVRTGGDDEYRLSFFYSMKAGSTGRVHDTYYYFLGPKDRGILGNYNDPKDNGFGLEDLNMKRIIPGASFMLALADGLKFILKGMYAVIPNYGIIIIIFTLIIELLMLPITKKSYNTTTKLRRVGPEIRQIKQKYQYDKGKMMEQLREIYAREHIKGRPNIIPLLIHLPIFLILFSILNTYIDFRMEMFIPGWIPDISRPDAIIDISPMAIPILGWTALRGLPILMFITALVQSRYTQPPDQFGRSMIFMSFLLPILLLFVMYNMPSGVVLYWTVHSLWNIGYQFYRKRRG